MEFALVLYICPGIVVLASIIGIFLINKWFVMPLLTFVVFAILTFTIFNETFFIWAIIYSIISIIVSLFTIFIKKQFCDRKYSQ